MGNNSSTQLSPVSVWALAAGGMAGGGIYTVLGVVIAVSAQWSWLAFVVTGIVALCSAYSYVFLTNKFHEEGGAFIFLEKVNDKKMAGNLSWLLILGYVLTISVYAFAFGHYVSYAFHGNPLLTRILAAGVVTVLILLNLAGVGKLTRVEIVIVSINLLVLVALGAYGVSQWDPVQLVAGIEPRPAWSVFFGGAAIFMGYEGFQLLTYEYDKIKNPKKTFMPVMLSAVIFVILAYVLVALGATMLGGAVSMISFKQIALSVASKSAFGLPGLIVMTIAAAFATAAAINSTLFSTANLSKRIASQKELPAWFNHTNGNGIPDRSIVLLGTLAGTLAVIGSLSSLVEAASLVFLFTFGVVNYIAFRESNHRKWIPATGMVVAALVMLSLVFRLAISKPIALSGIVLLIVLIVLGRPLLLKSNNKQEK
ncbi:APC family permease [Marixanthomonas spongiae]|uniref:Amino acid permease n=1 Tax=Marixanthomonas spongiae TaxID=2174845 RepID=A0A2U0I241_9FLAO|nr:APC family permease [Marixanthomonas spongiae]PVW15168.1 amino acid permease [Marixanthomonas spongiae]